MSVYHVTPTQPGIKLRLLVLGTDEHQATRPPAEGLFINIVDGQQQCPSILSRCDVRWVIEELSGWLERTEPHAHQHTGDTEWPYTGSNPQAKTH